jgi:hypothetical protein
MTMAIAIIAVKIEIPWIKPTDKYNQYKRWLDYWASSTAEEEEAN